MEQLINYIITVLKGFSAGKQLFFTVILIVLIVFVQKNSIFKIIGYLKKIIGIKRSIRQKDLLKHDLFIEKENYLRLAQNGYYGCIARNSIFRIIMTEKINAIIHNAEKLLKNGNLNDLDIFDYKKTLIANVSKIIKDYNDKVKQSFIEIFKENGTEIYELTMNHYVKGFNTWHEKAVNHIELFIDDLCRASVFDNNIERTQIYLYELNRAVYTTLTDIEKIYRGFNGDLDKLINKKQ